MVQTHLFTTRTGPSASEDIIAAYIKKDYGHFIAITDDRIFVNVFRRAVISELSLPSSALTVVVSEDQALRTVKEMSVKRRSVIVFIQTTLNNRRLDDLIKVLAWKIPNCKVVLITIESELPTLALLREQKIANNWIMKPVVIRELLDKVATIIKPHGAMETLVSRAEAYLGQGSYKHVLTICRKIFEAVPNSPVASMLMGDAFKGLAMEDEMIHAYENASFADELFLEPLQKLVEYFREKKDPQREVLYLEKLDALSPLNMDRKMDIARIHLDTGNEDDAKCAFESVMKLTAKQVNDSVSATATKIGKIYAQRGNPEAEVYLRKAIEVYGDNLDKSHMHLFNNLGILLRRNGKWREAVDEYEKALKVDPDNEIILYNAALAYDAGNDIPRANFCMRKALHLNPDFYKQDAVAACNVGMVFCKAGMKKEALGFVKHALEVNAEYSVARELYAEIAKKH